MLKFTERPKTLGWLQKKTVLSLKGISRFTGDFVLISPNLDETKVDMVQFTKRWN